MWPPVVPILAPADPMAFDLGCLLGCRTSLAAGRMAVPFGSPAAAVGVARMTPDERALATAGLPLTTVSPGVSVGVRLATTLRAESALVVADAPLAITSPLPDGWAGRLVWQPHEAVAFGGSGFWDGGRDRAVGGDLALQLGWWSARTAVARQHIGDVGEVFGDDTLRRRIRGTDVSLGVARDLGRLWTVDVAGAARAWDPGPGNEPASWARASASLAAHLDPAARWTVIELAQTVSSDDSEPVRRISSRVDITGRRGRRAAPVPTAR